MTPEPHLTARAALKRAFDECTREGAEMQRLLIELISERDEVRMPLIRAQQRRLDEVAARYREAQERYVREVMANATVKGSLPDAAEYEHAPQST